MSGLSVDCCKPAPPALDNASGKEEVFAGLPSYVTGSPSSSAAVLFATDVFGKSNPESWKLADKVAAAGYFVVVPDFLRGEPFVLQAGPNPLAGGPAWLAKHPPSEGALDVKKVVEELQSKGKSSLGFAGFCWGAKVGALVGKDHTFKAIVQLHPSFVEPSDYEEVKVPISVLAAPVDHAEIAESILSGRKDIESFVKIFPNASHGWTIRYDENNLQEVAAAEEAHNDMLNWLGKFLPVTNCPVSKEATATAAEGQPELL
ncbi:unnamed protein product [Sphagnum troendelagicum]|uniref:Dienelactone hydrolase domain-containing protein n=1 Tax=Sphagnum troendelagicum TaxID=128251 RepID=A0ABP0V1K2_9BRYO